MENNGTALREVLELGRGHSAANISLLNRSAAKIFDFLSARALFLSAELKFEIPVKSKLEHFYHQQKFQQYLRSKRRRTILLRRLR